MEHKELVHALTMLSCRMAYRLRDEGRPLTALRILTHASAVNSTLYSGFYMMSTKITMVNNKIMILNNLTHASTVKSTLYSDFI